MPEEQRQLEISYRLVWYQPSVRWVPGLSPGVNRPGRSVDHPPPSSAEVKERVELYLNSPSGPSWPVVGRTLPLPLKLSEVSYGEVLGDRSAMYIRVNFPTEGT
jgi:hypothetical protein